MNLVLGCVTKKYAQFSGRAPRKEYWLFVLTFYVLFFLLAFIDGAIGMSVGEINIGLLGSIFGIALLLPFLATGVRRLHDTNRSGWWYFIVLIPIIGTIWILILFCLKGTDGENRFGPKPLNDGLT